MPRNRKIILFIPVIAVIIVALFLFIQNRKYISGKEWYEKQEYYMDNFQTIADDMDNAMSLYLSGSIDQNDFLTHVYIIQTELNILKADYDTYKEKHPVRTGSYDYYEKSAVDATEKLFDIFQNMMDMMNDKAGDPDLLAYERSASYLHGFSEYTGKVARKPDSRILFYPV